MLLSIDWSLVTDVSGQPVRLIFKGLAVQEHVTINQCCVTSQKSEDIIDTPAEA
jgi:hypothetical protein